jgi:hypothetical protein
MKIELHIEELVLHGFAPNGRYGIGDAVKRELARLLSEGDIPPSWNRDADIARLDGGTFQMSAGALPTTIGTQIANTVYLSIGGEKSASEKSRNSTTRGRAIKMSA